MLKILNRIIRRKTQTEKQFDFFALPSSEKKKMVIKATREANKSQIQIVKEYEKKFGNT